MEGGSPKVRAPSDDRLGLDVRPSVVRPSLFPPAPTGELISSALQRGAKANFQLLLYE